MSGTETKNSGSTGATEVVWTVTAATGEGTIKASDRVAIDVDAADGKSGAQLTGELVEKWIHSKHEVISKKNMTTVVHKFPIKIAEEFTIPTDLIPNVVHIGLQQGKPYMWVELETNYLERNHKTTYKVFMTGEEIPEDWGEHCGSFQLEMKDGFIFVGHLYEKE